VNEGAVSVVDLAAVDKIDLPQGSWSRMVLTGSTAGAGSSLGYSVFTPGTELAMVCHETEELAYVVAGRGELRLEDGSAEPFEAGQGIAIPAGVWHAVVNTGAEDVVMVFGFPHPDYPPTERR
jgi:quercetin dioxygenase-like cupin family protein